jgi:pyridinium-3,5-bisthiocarboxylic acid mononucleotide nickel chelatase
MPVIAYLDCFSGISGDMLLGALVDAGWPVERLQAVVKSLQLDNVQIQNSKTSKHGIAGTLIHVVAPHEQIARGRDDLLEMIRRAGLATPVEERAAAVINTLAEAESEVHQVPVEAIHFHEIGAIDTLVDIVGTIVGLDELGVEAVYSAPLPWSSGTAEATHGILPVPPPAVALLLKGLPVIGVDVQGEMVTPTGAALTRVLACDFGPMPTMRIARIGYGAGQRDWPERPNLLRLVIGQMQANTEGLLVETLTVLACNIDDMNPQWYGPLVETLLEAQALDVWLTPAQMKKNRPATVVEVLCRPSQSDELRRLLLHQTTTLGVREYTVARYCVERHIETVQTRYGPVRVKVGKLPGGGVKASPEHDDCLALAAEHQVSVREVWTAAVQAAKLLQ